MMIFSLRNISILNFVAVAGAVFSLVAFLFYVGQENARSIEALKRMEGQHEAAQDLRTAIDEVLYFSAEMANSLSDDSLDRFDAASRHAQTLIAEINDEALRSSFADHRQKIETASLAALDAYVGEDRALADAYMAGVRLEAARLRSATAAHVTRYREMRNAEAESIRRRSAFVTGAAITLAAIAVLILVASAFFLWSTLFRPITALIAAISRAAESPNRASDCRIASPPQNEIGDAGRALNRLLDAVSGAIAEARALASEARRAELRWKALFEESPDAIVILDPETTRIIDFNPSTQRLLCLAQDDKGRPVGLTGAEIHHHEIEEFRAFIERIQTDGSARSDSLSCSVADKRIPVSVVGVSAPHEEGTALLMHIRDISDQRRYEAALDAARIEAERANAAKSDFLANMSHEIRTPMNGVIGMADVLLNSGLTAKQRELAEIIVRSGNSLIAIINDILDFSKLEAGKFTLTSQGFNLRSVAQEVGQLLSARAVAKDIELIVQYAPNLPNGVVGDASRIRQVLTNLAGNAVKFTEHGYVHICVSGEHVGAEARLRFEVRDTGIGVAPDELPRMFDKFVQADTSKTRKYEGTGLGLAICRELVGLMGGRIGADSAPGAGSTFWFELTLPVDPSIAPAARSLSSALTGVRVLAVDDNAINRRLLAELFEAWDLRFTIVESAAEGLLALDKSLRDRDRYRLIVTDFHMPGMSGDDFVTRLQAEPRFAAIPVIMLSSVEYAQTSDDRVRGRYARWIAKPVRASGLMDAIVESLADATQDALFAVANDMREAVSDDAGDCADRSARPLVLVAEDNLVNQMVFKSLVDKDRYAVEIADNGRIAVEQFTARRPDIIIMDLSMPEMNGLEAAAAIRQLERERGWPRTPIIAATAHVLAEDKTRCRDAGMDGFLAKPLRSADLTAMLEEWCGEAARTRLLRA